MDFKAHWAKIKINYRVNFYVHQYARFVPGAGSFKGCHGKDNEFHDNIKPSTMTPNLFTSRPIRSYTNIIFIYLFFCKIINYLYLVMINENKKIPIPKWLKNLFQEIIPRNYSEKWFQKNGSKKLFLELLKELLPKSMI